MSSFITCTLRHIVNNDQVKEDEMGRACSTNGCSGECVEDFGGKAIRKEP
jgi:hypothetical protein